MRSISNCLSPLKKNRIGEITPNQLRVTVWLKDEGSYKWYASTLKKL